MKLIHVRLFFGVSICLAGCRNNKQQNKTPFVDKQPTQADNHKDEISRIDNFVHTVNDHKHSFTIEKEIDGTDDSGQLIGYYDHHVLTKIDVWLGMSNNALTQEFYFKNGHLVFAEETRKYYSWEQDKGQLNRNEYSKIRESKYYFRHGILVQHTTDGKITTAKSEMKSLARLYIKFLSMKENTVYVNQ